MAGLKSASKSKAMHFSLYINIFVYSHAPNYNTESPEKDPVLVWLHRKNSGAKKAAIRAEDIAKGVFVPFSSLPQREPTKGVQTA
ncbi:hypothetical protein B7R76_00205 [Mageeibacillus indolicus]|uniref:Uncharacterized protein n=1 Tax=Mageeibacillus indolicus TaxID=884684 RepID=A0A2J8B3J2_9FIRM|nr:hypothetical protein B7R76_00205 [Mageeibacillus indolicus]